MPPPLPAPKGSSWGKRTPPVQTCSKGSPSLRMGPPLSPKPQPSQCPQPFRVLTLWDPVGSLLVRRGLGGLLLFFPRLHLSTGLPPLPPSPRTTPQRQRGPFGAAPPQSSETGGVGWVEDPRLAKAGGVVSSGSPLPRGWGGRERLWWGRASRGGTRPPVRLQEARIGTCSSTMGEGTEDPQTERIRP